MLAPPITSLRQFITHAIRGVATEAEVTELAKIAYTLASTRLKQLLSSGRLHLQSFNIPLEGIAFDCIAELFERDADGVFVELLSCFQGERALELLLDEEILQLFRHAVFFSIEDGIYRIYREHDPILGRIIRNLKLALRQEPRLMADKRFGQLYLSIDEKYDRLEHLPPFPQEVIEQKLHEFLQARESSVSAVHSVAELLSSEDKYRRSVPLVDVAVVIKRIATQNDVPISSLSLVDESLFEYDIAGIVKRAGDAALEELHDKYVDTGKMKPKRFAEYSEAIRLILEETYVSNDGSAISQGSYLRRFVSGLTEEGYREHHRSVFEYMVRTAKRIVQRELRELL